jgi:hypothetical protein
MAGGGGGWLKTGAHFPSFLPHFIVVASGKKIFMFSMCFHKVFTAPLISIPVV